MSCKPHAVLLIADLQHTHTVHLGFRRSKTHSSKQLVPVEYHAKQATVENPDQ